MRSERGLTTGETVLTLGLCAVIFLVGLGLGGAFDSESSKPAEPPRSGSATATTESPTTAYTGEPTSEELAALSLATATASERAEAAAAKQGALTGAKATAAVLGQKAKARVRAAERAAYWAAVGVTINSLHGLVFQAERLRTAQQVKRNQALLRRLQARTLFALGRLRQMQVSAERRRLAGLLVSGVSRSLDRTVAQSERVLGAAAAKTANQAARELTRTSAALNRTLTEMEVLYSQAVEAAANGDEAQAEALLGQLERMTARL